MSARSSRFNAGLVKCYLRWRPEGGGPSGGRDSEVAQLLAASGCQDAAMSGTEIGLVVSVFIACTVEAVEALTIVLAVGATRSWRSAMIGVGVALLALAAVTAALGPALTALPINVLRGVVGGLLLVFGLQWLRKAILRAGGLKALHDEAPPSRRRPRPPEVPVPSRMASTATPSWSPSRARSSRASRSCSSRSPSGPTRRTCRWPRLPRRPRSSWWRCAGVALRAPLARVPENTLKFVVGVMLTSFGVFWGGEGVHAHWPGGETALLVIVPLLLLFSLGTVAALRRRRGSAADRAQAAGA